MGDANRKSLSRHPELVKIVDTAYQATQFHKMNEIDQEEQTMQLIK